MDTVDLMRSLIAVAECGSFTKAGKRLDRSKAVISKQVNELESRLGARLLNRTTRQVALTDVGRAYVERARELIADLEGLEDSVRTAQGRPMGRLRITAPQAFGEFFLTDIIARFQTAYPDILLEIKLDDRFVDLVSEGYDIALRMADLSDSSFIAKKLAPNSIFVCASPDYLERHGRPESPADLAQHLCIVDSNFRGGANWRFQNGMEAMQIAVRSSLIINSASAVRQMVVAGRGIAMCPEFVVWEDIAAGRLKILLDEHHVYENALYAVYPHRLHLSGRVRAFIDHLSDEFKNGPPWKVTRRASTVTAVSQLSSAARLADQM